MKSRQKRLERKNIEGVGLEPRRRGAECVTVLLLGAKAHNKMTLKVEASTVHDLVNNDLPLYAAVYPFVVGQEMVSSAHWGAIDDVSR